MPRSHNLNALRNLIPSAWPLTQQYLDLTDLTEWAVEARYPGDWPDPTAVQAEESVHQARALYDAVQRDLTAHGFEGQREGIR